MCIDVRDRRGYERGMLETLTLKQVSSLVNIKRRTLYNMIKDGRFPVLPIPGTKPPRWSRDAVQAWVDGRGAV